MGQRGPKVALEMARDVVLKSRGGKEVVGRKIKEPREGTGGWDFCEMILQGHDRARATELAGIAPITAVSYWTKYRPYILQQVISRSGEYNAENILRAERRIKAKEHDPDNHDYFEWMKLQSEITKNAAFVERVQGKTGGKGGEAVVIIIENSSNELGIKTIEAEVKTDGDKVQTTSSPGESARQPGTDYFSG